MCIPISERFSTGHGRQSGHTNNPHGASVSWDWGLAVARSGVYIGTRSQMSSRDLVALGDGFGISKGVRWRPRAAMFQSPSEEPRAAVTKSGTVIPSAVSSLEE